MQLRYQNLLLILSVILATFIISGCSSKELGSCLAYDPLPLKVSFDKVVYDSSSHKLETEGKVYYEYYKDIIAPAIADVTFDLKDSIKTEGSMDYLFYKHKPIESTLSDRDGSFKYKGTFTDDMILYIHFPGAISIKYDLKDLLIVQKVLSSN